VGSVLTTIIHNFTPREQIELLERLQTYLSNQEILDHELLAASNMERVIQQAQDKLLLKA
jgi:phosphatidate cytidylyltransferase